MVAVRGDIIPLLTDEGPERCPYSCCWLPSATPPNTQYPPSPSCSSRLKVQAVITRLMPRWAVAAKFCPCTAVHKQAWPRLIDKKTLIFTKDFAETFRKKLN